MWHKLIKYLASSLNYKRYVSTLPYIYFPSRMKYSSRNSFVMAPRSTMTSDHLMKILLEYLGVGILLPRHISEKPILLLFDTKLVQSELLLTYLLWPMKWLCVVNSWYLRISMNYISLFQTDYPIRLFLTLEYPLHRYWIYTFCFYFSSLDRNPCFSWRILLPQK